MQPTLKREEYEVLSFAERIVKEFVVLWAYFKTTIPRVLAESKILNPTSDLARGRAQGPGVCTNTLMILMQVT